MGASSTLRWEHGKPAEAPPQAPRTQEPGGLQKETKGTKASAGRRNTEKEMKTASDGLLSRLDMAEQRIFELEDIVKVKVAQSCPTPCDRMDYTIYGILQTEHWSG